MANLIQIKRSTTTAAPTSLSPGELAFTSNGDTLWVGSPSGSNTANVIHIGAKISYIGNSTQIGASAGGSNTELASTYAIKQFVDGKFSAYSTTLAGLTDVDVAGVGNNNFLIYDAVAGKWEDHTVSGTASQITATFTGNDLTLSLPTDVIVNSSISVGNSTVNSVINSTSLTTKILSVGNTTITGFANITTTLAAGNTTITGFLNVSSTANVQTLNVSGDATISGNLAVNGTLTTINTTNLNITDPLIRLANSNLTTDIVDIGSFGSFGNSTVTQYTGIFRDASDSGIYKVFTGAIPVPGTTVDTANVNFAYGTIQAFLKTGGTDAGGLIANATTIAITANATLNVAITANTLTLSTALAGTSGGTGLNAYTAEDILVANSTNGFRKLALGTDGYVLQSNGTALVYSTLDGGTF